MSPVRSIVFLLMVFIVQTASHSVCAADALWEPFASLGAADQALADAALADMFGEDPELWPDWLDPRAVLIAAGREGALLIVREPYRQACGQYFFTIFGPQGSNGGRNRLGDGFCAGSLAVLPIKGRSFPDLIFSEGRQKEPADDGQWLRVDQQVRWTGAGWARIITK